MIDLHPYIFIFSGWIFFLVSYYLFEKRVFHPAVLMSLLWAFIFSVERVLKITILKDLNTLSLNTYLVVFSVLFCFFLGGLLSKTVLQHNTNHTIRFSAQESLKKSGSWILLMFVIFLFLCLPIYIKSILSIQSKSANENFLIAIRSEIIYGEMDIGPTKYLVAFSVVVMAIANYLYRILPTRLNRYLFYSISVISLVYNFLYTGRISIFLIFIVMLGVRSFFILKNPIQILMKILLGFGILFSIMGVLYEKGGSVSESADVNAQGSAIFTGLYLVGPIHGLNFHLQKHEAADFSGEHTLGFFLRMRESFASFSRSKYLKTDESFLFMPYPTNVYSAFRSYLRDFGIGYLFLMFFLFGYLHSYVFQKAIVYKNIRYVLYYAFLLFPLLLSFFDDQYMSIISSWLKVVLYIELFLFIVFLSSFSQKIKNKFSIKR